VLIGLLALFFPGETLAGLKHRSVDPAFSATPESHTVPSVLSQTLQLSRNIGRELFALENLRSFRFWLFLYLVLCVGSHMAPSASDYRGAAGGSVIALSGMIGLTFLLALVGVPIHAAIFAFLTATAPLFAVLTLTVLLCGLATLAISVVTSLFAKKYVVR
jgi:hypothetical protein